ncbi:uncharacterized protein YdhG (YjbR/CyaY superfamily) [Agromyces flavus]|uniref:Uncharacterized conserved protein YdhG, YjbR/CyaY-like superfamily, DUF1801 family n=1 Tax=Agromyces flavus TaxID=589382 RepID=A0A1H1WN76_9MICO|nr:hypothetical protein [Agromyces flavus]MCP2366204.1 uncharacterized protein YdhG (YjbR/CyaY superfamily) [Agromyces flavus]GGI44206.1 hypothetical protein GCM10010932_03450 [Agromyces flavus]SDS98100.1 Uncharacterized conserved protein YdhG, YjbR/CyaY-like superfamily, DUF1801 family [Agromyces flavus]
MSGNTDAAPQTVEDYIASFPDDIADRLRRTRAAILAEVPHPEEKMRYGIAAVMLGGRYALHFAGWKQHIGIYPVPTLPDPLESEVAPLRSGKDSVTFTHSVELPDALISRITAAIVSRRAAAAD